MGQIPSDPADKHVILAAAHAGQRVSPCSGIVDDGDPGERREQLRGLLRRNRPFRFHGDCFAVAVGHRDPYTCRADRQILNAKNLPRLVHHFQFFTGVTRFLHTPNLRNRVEGNRV